MRYILATLLGLVCLASAGAQATKDDQPSRKYGIAADLERYPQATPKEALGSALKAIGAQRIDYLLAQLADPQFVDMRVKDYGGNFDEVVREAKRKLVEDPAVAKQFQSFYKDGEWEEGDTTASVRLKDVKDRIYLRKQDNRWFMENRKKAEEPAK
jgi:hypothetical protein